MKLGLVIPLYISNRQLLSYLPGLLNSVKSKHEMHLFAVHNFIADELVPEFTEIFFSNSSQFASKTVLIPQGKQGVAKAWNLGIAKAKESGCDYIGVLNLDTILHEECLNRMVELGETSSPDLVLWSGNDIMDEQGAVLDKLVRPVELPDFSLFMVRKDFTDVMGNFDENFSPYGDDDWDMVTRIENSYKKCLRLLGAYYFHYKQSTAKTDPEWSKMNGQESNRGLFVKKWGNVTNKWGQNAYFKTPYNDPSIGVNEWKKL